MLQIEGIVTDVGDKWNIPIALQVFAPRMQMHSMLLELQYRVDLRDGPDIASSDRTATTPSFLGESSDQLGDDESFWSEEQTDDWDSDDASFHAFLDINSEQCQMKFKELEEDEKRRQGHSPRELSPFDPTAPSRRHPAQPSTWWLQQWIAFVDTRWAEWDRQRSRESSVERVPVSEFLPTSVIDHHGQEYQMFLKGLEEQERRRQGYYPRELSPFDLAAGPRQEPLEQSDYWTSEWIKYVSGKMKESQAQSKAP
jgi:hypothetical protein